ncbi:MAG: pyridoxamine 5'-phosphate oxidase [Lautropia sp.]|nr:MAG: pyridoxamine 5'-phosphate oxidase [Pseudomonadota bacterium]MBC6960013.1 pyridoxamine 5'-phosphate oxidase [Lautropia sp.]MCL4701922.1 pyridoxamine 5'-phosphate oxidase family protein [Burkholderiaceae bacterium]MCZ2412795.1 pyridoxamine 5'-phosphate oxidase family protein [Burkholderiales bacterium]MDL1907531.1 pyridoxamine 5'-phosphate oxidase [Betaproteobacteria bacterium PRO1]
MTGPVRERVLAYLRAHHVMTLATQGSAGPWAAAVFYASEGLTLYFLSAPSTRHATELAAHARVAATIQDDCADWAAIRGIQLEGEAREVRGTQAERARTIYGAKFPALGSPERAPAPIAAAFAKIRWYRIVPDRLYFVDNSLGFGHRDQLIPVG